MPKDKLNIDNMSDEQVQDILDHAYMELGDTTKIKIKSELMSSDFANQETFVENFVSFLRSPENLQFVAEYILNIKLLPFQVAVLWELWTKPFPMLIASRGASKTYMLSVYVVLRSLLDQGSRICVVGAALRQSLVLFNYILNIWDNAPILQNICGKGSKPKRELHMCTWKCGSSEVKFLPLGDGETIRGQRACVMAGTLIETNRGLIRIEDSDKYMYDLQVYTGSRNNMEYPYCFVKTKPIEAFKIVTAGYYEITCSSLHKLKTRNGWKLAKDLIPDEDEIQFNRDYTFPTEYQYVNGRKIDEDLGFLLGILVSEGSVNNKYYVAVKMTDKECIDYIHSALLKVDPSFTIGRSEHEARPREGFIKTNKLFSVRVSDMKFRQFLANCGLEYKKSRQKRIPWSILQSPRSVVKAFLEGMFWGDGSSFLYKSKQRDNNLGVAYYTGSEVLAHEMQILLTKFTGMFVGLGTRKSNLSGHLQYYLRLYGVSGLKINQMLDIPKWKPIYEKAYKELKEINRHEYLKVKDVYQLEGLHNLYDYQIDKDHCFLGNCFVNHNTVVISDEFSSINPEVFETVVRGFAAVRSQGLVENVQLTYKHQMMQELGFGGKEEKEESDYRIKTSTNLGCNQLIISGSASYQFNHFYKYYSYYKTIIESGGDLNYIRQKYPDMQVVEGLRTEDYCIIRLPYELLPPGMMDKAVLSQGRATMNPAIFDMEYGCVFHADSDGFYPASLIHACTCPFVTANGLVLDFPPKMISTFDNYCVMGIDPASEKDNFTINILEYDGMYRRIVYQWSITRKRFQEFKHQKLVPDDINDYLTFCIKHIRSLYKRFNIQMIVMDAGGGGLSIKEGLQDLDKCGIGEKPIYDMDDEMLQGQDGFYVLKMINFQSDQWRKEAHHGLKKDLSDRKILFPKFDSLAVAENEYLEFENLKYEDIESLYLEIEQLKYEMTIIKHDSTPTGGEKWDVPKIKSANSEEITKMMKKDRFTSLLLSNWGCRLIYANENNNTNMELIGTNIAPNSAHTPAHTEIRYLHNNKKRLRPIVIDDENYRFFNH